MQIRTLCSIFAVSCVAFLNPASFTSGASNPAASNSTQEISTYLVRVDNIAPPRIAVTATLPINGTALKMDTTRPGNIPELGKAGWPALVHNLQAFDANDRHLEATSAGTAGWKLTNAYAGRLTLKYEVDYALLAANGWPAPREAGFIDADNIVLAARSLFITTSEVKQSVVTFKLPSSWRPVTPWLKAPGSESGFLVRAPEDLVVNLFALSRSVPDVVKAGGFRLLVIGMGHWKAARAEVNQVLRSVIPRLVKLVGFEGRENYLVILLPMAEFGGESYRQSFAFTSEEKPSRANRALWGQTLAHEVFHYWNGWRLRGSDYASSQWFQEGFTEYAADVAMLRSRLITEEEFREKLSNHVRKYRNLKTTLEAPGTSKGPPLYSGGALVALLWDIRIRQATNGKKNIGDFLRTLWRQTNEGSRTYGWREISAALNSTVIQDWNQFYSDYIKGTKPLPLKESLAYGGLQLVEASDGTSHIEPDPAATPAAKSLWRGLISER